jgi:hypothetical protein
MKTTKIETLKTWSQRTVMKDLYVPFKKLRVHKNNEWVLSLYASGGQRICSFIFMQLLVLAQDPFIC